MLYILPPPPNPTPSSWPSILCSPKRNSGQDPWNAVASTVEPSKRRPPKSQNFKLKSRKKVSESSFHKIYFSFCAVVVYF